MSPLACSLLALAALLATAHGRCRTKHVGRRSGTRVPLERVYFQPPGTNVDVNDSDCPPGMHIVGEDIVTCNNDPDGPAPEIEGPPLCGWAGWSYYVRCNEDDCPYGGYTDTTLYCDYYNTPMHDDCKH